MSPSLACWRAGLFLALAAFVGSTTWASPGTPLEGFVEVNGVRLQYLDWGGSGTALILVHGLGDNAHIFDDLAPAFTDHFHVIAYTRRGSGNSEVKGPYGVATFTEDLLGVMDALGITQADLVGHSAGGAEITELAAEHPERVGRIVYFDAAYDYGTSEFQAAYKALPIPATGEPAGAMASIDAFRSYQKAVWFPGLNDMGRIEADLREKLIIQPDGSVKDRVAKEVVDALFFALQTDKPYDYTRVRCPALAIYPEHLYDLRIGDTQRRDALVAYEGAYWNPFRAHSIDRLRVELKNVEVVRVPGAHSSFFLTDRQEVVDIVRRFLGQTTPQQLARLSSRHNTNSGH
jgi:pimeloyl-ACP methyl ester carboxylesterase